MLDTVVSTLSINHSFNSHYHTTMGSVIILLTQMGNRGTKRSVVSFPKVHTPSEWWSQGLNQPAGLQVCVLSTTCTEDEIPMTSTHQLKLCMSRFIGLEAVVTDYISGFLKQWEFTYFLEKNNFVYFLALQFRDFLDGLYISFWNNAPEDHASEDHVPDSGLPRGIHQMIISKCHGNKFISE